jgi:hypothetical protein
LFCILFWMWQHNDCPHDELGVTFCHANNRGCMACPCFKPDDAVDGVCPAACMQVPMRAKAKEEKKKKKKKKHKGKRHRREEGGWDKGPGGPRGPPGQPPGPPPVEGEEEE